jgi:hypothetical protein
MELTEKETLEKVLKLLKRMWMHDHDGSELFPVPESFWVSENHFEWEKVTERRQHLRHHIKTDPSQSLLFEVMHEEIFPLIEKALKK